MTDSVGTISRARELRARAAERDLGRRALWTGVAACSAGVASFLLLYLTGWPPHEDETLPLFVGREPLGNLFDIVLGERGGAPLHFLLAWTVAHGGGGLTALRFLSALFAVASLPVIAALGARLAGRSVALAATVLASAAWVLLFHGIYARMYSLFLFLSALSYLALLRATERGGRGAWALWALAVLLAISAHPYGALVLASQGLYVLLARARLREGAVAFAAVVLLATPFWRSNLVLANRFDVGVGGGGSKLGSPGAVLRYLYRVAGDYSSGYRAVLVLVLVFGALGLLRLARDRPPSALLAACVIVTPALFFLVGRFGSSSAAPESRHLIFALPFFAVAVAAGVVGGARVAGPAGPILGVVILAALVAAEVSWAMHKTPALFKRENPARVSARGEAAAWLARTSRPSDVLFAYEPLYLAAWERARSAVSRTAVPRADPKLTLQALTEAPKPLGRGVWVFDAGDTNNAQQRLSVELRLPFPRAEFDGRVDGPYLVIRTRRPTRTIERFLDDARKAQLIGKSLGMGDADVNYVTVRRAQARWERLRRR